MHWTISMIFLSLWSVGIATHSTLHGYLHILLALAAATLLIPVFRRKKQPLE